MDISIKELEKSFGTHRVLDNINLELEGLHTIGILGASGSGKTTLLRILAGLEIPNQGRVRINSHLIPYDGAKTIDASTGLREYRKRLGVVFQSFNLLPHLSALHNITLPLVKVHGWEKKKAEEKAFSLLRQFSLDTHAHKRSHQLSGGQKQRVAICRAIAPSPEFLLFDEPTSALDPDFIVEVLEAIRALRELCDFIIVTHHTGFAKSVSDYILFLDKGNIAEHGTAREVFENSTQPAVRKYFDNVLKY